VIAALELGTVSTAKASTPPCRDCGVEAVAPCVTVTVKVKAAHHSLCSRCFIRGGYLESEVVR
jgi:hypothetical protein